MRSKRVRGPIARRPGDVPGSYLMDKLLGTRA